MKLRPTIASYSGQSYAAIRAFLSDEALDAVARVARSPLPAAEMSAALRDELVEMHVLRVQDDTVRLDTAVFLEEDIQRINVVATEIGRELAQLASDLAADLRHEHPVAVNFLVGIIGIGQSLGQALKAGGVALNWSRYGGRYARSKVDFNEECAAFDALGQDLQNKTVLVGSQYTAVFIGPGGRNYCLPAQPVAGADSEANYHGLLNAYLTDAYALHVLGQLEHPALHAAAQQAGLYVEDRLETCVLTRESFARYLPTVQSLGRATQACFADRLDALRASLASTAAGRQGVPAGHMMMNLWRYLRRAVARELYASGFFRDRAPETGLITVFYANDIEALQALLG